MFIHHQLVNCTRTYTIPTNSQGKNKLEVIQHPDSLLRSPAARGGFSIHKSTPPKDLLSLNLSRLQKESSSQGEKTESRSLGTDGRCSMHTTVNAVPHVQLGTKVYEKNSKDCQPDALWHICVLFTPLQIYNIHKFSYAKGGLKANTIFFIFQDSRGMSVGANV